MVKKQSYEVYVGEMFRAGYEFYLSVNKVWLTEKVLM